MADRIEDRIRALIVELVESSPPPPVTFTESDTSSRGVISQGPTSAPLGRRRVLAAMSTVLAVLVAVIAYLVVNRTSSERVRVGASPSGVVLYADDGSTGIFRIDVESGRTTRVSLPGKNTGGDYTDAERLVARDGGIVFPSRNGNVYVVPYDLAGAPRILARGTRVIAAADDDNAVWILGEGEPSCCDVKKVRLDGRVLVAPVLLPGSRVVDGVIQGRLLVQGPSGPFELWDPASGRLDSSAFPRREDRAAGAEVVAVHGTIVAWTTRDCRGRVLHLLNTSSGRDRPVDLHEGSPESLLGAFSPDGATLAVRALRSGCVGPPSATSPSVTLIDVRSGAVRSTITPPNGNQVIGPLAWARSGKEIYYGEVSPGSVRVGPSAPEPTPALAVYDVRSGHSGTVNGPDAPYFALIAP